jgi:taurine---2-oxoglutarate transaminase
MSAPTATTNPATTNAEAAVDDPAYVFHSWSAQALIDPLPIAGGEGAWFWDHEGNRYLDGSSQLVNLNLGHQHPAIVEAIKAQADRLCTVAPTFASDVRGQAARMIVERAGAGFAKVFFTNGGAEATENAVRMAKVHTGRHKVLAHYRSYHGATHGSIALTGDPRRWPSEPSLPGVVHFHGPYPYRSSFGATTPEEETERALAHLDEVLMYEGAHTVAAVIVESVVGTNGILVPPPGYLAGLAERCRAHGILLICDEVMAGFGRCGAWFAFQRFDVQPDLICFAKGVNSGYVPLGGVVISEAVAATFAERAYPGGLTYSGHPLACASAVASMQAFEDDDVLAHVDVLEREVWAPGLAELAAKHPSVGEVRGIGCFWAVELVRDPATREPLVPYNASGAAAAPMAELVAACKAGGLWPFTHFNRLHVVPPLVISVEDARLLLDILDTALDVADAHVV